MATLKRIEIKENISTLKKLKKEYGYSIQKRLSMLIELKKSKEGAISKRVLATLIGVDPNSITKWKRVYESNGIDGLLKDERIGFKPSIVSHEEHIKLEALLNNPKNGIIGYKELQEWVKTELNKEMLYITLLKYVERNFGTKIKVARKSHIKKDEKKIESFKKTSVKSVQN